MIPRHPTSSGGWDAPGAATGKRRHHRFRTQQNPIRGRGFGLNPRRGLSLRDLAALNATGANSDPLCRSIHQGLDGLKVHIPASTRHVVGVRNVITELRTFAANIAYLCHRFAPNLGCFVPPRPTSDARFASSFTPRTGARRIKRSVIIEPLSGRKSAQDTRRPRLAEFPVYLELAFEPNLSARSGFQ